MSARRYLSVEAYLAKLPAGLDSYPDVRAKGGLVLEFTSGLPPEAADGLPEPLAALLRKPPAASAWVPEVHLSALTLARIEFLGMSNAEFSAWCHQQNLKLLRQPLNRLLMMVATPPLLLRGASSRFESFHQGTRILALPRGHNEWAVTLSFRPHLLPEIVLDAFRTAVQAAMEVAGAKDVQCVLAEKSEQHALLSVRWG